MSTGQLKYVLEEKDMPTEWYNIQADLPTPLPPVIHPGRMDPVGPDDLAPLFPPQLIMQEVSQERYHEIPKPVLDVYRQWRPSPLYRARNLEVFQVAISKKTKPMRSVYMETFGAKCHASPSDRTKIGKQMLEGDASCPGSLGIAISEAVEATVTSAVPTKYALGSVLNHVLMHQTIIGQEAIKQMEMAGDYPDVLVGCTGGGSNFGGLCFPFIGQKLRKEAPKPCRVVAVEPAACPSLTRGKYAYDFGDTGKMTPLMKTHTLGHLFMPAPDHAGGLRYHAMSPIISHLKEIGELDAVAYKQTECFEAGVLFAKHEGILPAPEANHAVKGAIEEALKAKAAGTAPVILFNLCGHGHFDMAAYEKFNAGEMVDSEFSDQVAPPPNFRAPHEAPRLPRFSRTV
jgi:tryptophan synthase beta chain